MYVKNCTTTRQALHASIASDLEVSHHAADAWDSIAMQEDADCSVLGLEGVGSSWMNAAAHRTLALGLGTKKLTTMSHNHGSMRNWTFRMTLLVFTCMQT